jgi:hypothetical protein
MLGQEQTQKSPDKRGLELGVKGLGETQSSGRVNQPADITQLYALKGILQLD